MSIEQDESLIRRETMLPGLGLLLDPILLRERLISVKGINDPGVLKGGYIRYKPGMNCIARFEFSRGGEHHFAYAKAFGAAAESKIQKAREADQVHGPLGSGRIVLEREKIIFSVFPNDSKLKSLTQLDNQGDREDLAERLFNPAKDWKAASFQILNYKPERRLVIKFTSRSGQHALVKFFTGPDFDNVRHFRKHMLIPTSVKIPQWIGGSKAHQAIAYSWLPGTTVREQSSDYLAEATRLAGLAIAHFHGFEQPRFKKRSLRVKTNQLRSLAQNLSALMPELKAVSGQLGKQMRAWWRAQPRVLQPIHGDFYDKQVVVHAGSASIIDSDDAHLGNPLSDLACFIAHLERHAITGPISSDQIPELRSALIAGYFEERPEIELSQLDRFVGFHLFQLLHNPFRDRDVHWQDTTTTLLNRSLELFQPT